MREVHIKPEAVDPNDVEVLLEDLVTAATNEALRAAQELASSKLGGATGGLSSAQHPGLIEGCASAMLSRLGTRVFAER